MGCEALKRICILFILLSASLVQSSFAGGSRKFIDKHTEVGAMAKETQKYFNREEEIGIHPRILKVKTNDYASYDPAPALVKPPFKLIPN